jgi:hypothetical protein
MCQIQRKESMPVSVKNRNLVNYSNTIFPDKVKLLSATKRKYQMIFRRTSNKKIKAFSFCRRNFPGHKLIHKNEMCFKLYSISLHIK